MPDAKWFAVYCGPQRESLADRVLRQRGYTTFFPHEFRCVSRPARMVKRPFMARYIFVRFAPGHESFYEVSEQPGVKEIVCAGVNARGERVPFPIPDCVMDRLFGMTDPLGTVCERVRKNCLVINGREAKSGQEVGFVEESPFWGLVAIIEDILDGGEQIRLKLKQLFGAERSLVVNSRQVSGAVRLTALQEA